jgi:hypothetical protein
MSTRKAYDVVRDAKGSFGVRYAFTVREVPSGSVHTVLETPDRFSLSVNDQPLFYTDQGWRMNTTLRTDVYQSVLFGFEQVRIVVGE